MTPIPENLSTFIRFIQLKSLRKRTEEEYVRWVVRLARQRGVACASLLGQEEVLAFLHDLQQNHNYEGSTLNQAVCALRLFFRDHLGRADWTCWAQIRIKRRAPLPVVLSRGEVRVLLGAVKEPRFMAVFCLMYHCGLRLGEACRLEVSHLDSGRGVLRVVDGKGGKNREVPVAPEMFARLRVWWSRHRHPRFLFPGLGSGWKDKYGSRLMAMREARQPMSESGVQLAMRAAVLTSRLKKAGISGHALRHSYATHLLEEWNKGQTDYCLFHPIISLSLLLVPAPLVSDSFIWIPWRGSHLAASELRV